MRTCLQTPSLLPDIFLIFLNFFALLFGVIERHASVTAGADARLQVLRTHAEKRSQILPRGGGGGGEAASEKEEDGHRTPATQTVSGQDLGETAYLR